MSASESTVAVVPLASSTATLDATVAHSPTMMTDETNTSSIKEENKPEITDVTFVIIGTPTRLVIQRVKESAPRVIDITRFYWPPIDPKNDYALEFLTPGPHSHATSSSKSIMTLNDTRFCFEPLDDAHNGTGDLEFRWQVACRNPNSEIRAILTARTQLHALAKDKKFWKEFNDEDIGPKRLDSPAIATATFTARKQSIPGEPSEPSKSSTLVFHDPRRTLKDNEMQTLAAVGAMITLKRILVDGTPVEVGGERDEFRIPGAPPVDTLVDAESNLRTGRNQPNEDREYRGNEKKL
ncbi:hypothetical protein C8R46DRAFT_1036032 [Mycena filopes]|nr:hypothetical protein C8R46DRAFT_1036032 [Mycena filopes]